MPVTEKLLIDDCHRLYITLTPDTEDGQRLVEDVKVSQDCHIVLLTTSMGSIRSLPLT
jgi:hypothetical protein